MEVMMPGHDPPEPDPPSESDEDDDFVGFDPEIEEDDDTEDEDLEEVGGEEDEQEVQAPQVDVPRPLATPSTAPPVARKKPTNIVYQNFGENPNHVQTQSTTKKTKKQASGNQKQAKHIQRSEKGGINFGANTVGIANKLKVKVPKSRPHTTTGTGQGGKGAHQIRNGRVVNTLNKELEKAAKKKGKNLKVMKTQMQRDATKKKREGKDQ